MHQICSSATFPISAKNELQMRARDM